MQINVLLFIILFLSSCQGQNNPNLLEANQNVASTANIITQSNDEGKTWQDLSKGLPEDIKIRRVLMQGDEVYLTSDKGTLYHSNDLKSGVWKQEDVSGMFTKENVSGLFACGTNTYASIYKVGFFKKVKGSTIWLPIHMTLEEKTVNDIAENTKGEIFVATSKGIYKTADEGKTWQHIYTKGWISSICISNDVMIASEPELGLIRSTDGREHWDCVMNDPVGIYNIDILSGHFAAFRIMSLSTKTAEAKPQRTYTSEDGKTWARIPETTFLSQPILDLEATQNYLFSSRSDGIFRSANNGATWESIRPYTATEKPFRYELIVSGQTIFAILLSGDGC